MDLRYRRQGFELNVAFDAAQPAKAIEAFHELHKQRYGFADEARPVEIVNLRLRMTAAGEPYEPVKRELKPGDGADAIYAEREVWFEGGWRNTRFYRREKLVPGDTIEGPAMITEYTSATLVPPGATARVDAFANIVIDVGEEANA